MSDRDLTTSRTTVFGHVDKGTICRVCGRDVTDGRAVYCSDYCRDIANAVMNLLNWSGVRRRIIERDDGTCQECGFKQEWLDRGNAFLIDIIESKLPDRPKGPALDEYDEWSQEELEEYWDASDEWREQRDELINEYFGVSWRGIQWPSPENRLEVDHIRPVTDDGHPFDPVNLRTLCEDCHAEKTAQENSERAEERRYERPDVEQEIADYITDGGTVSQATLDGQEAERVECEYREICTNPSEWRGELLAYDGVGYALTEILACQLCAEEHIEPEPPAESDKFERLKPADRFRVVADGCSDGGDA